MYDFKDYALQVLMAIICGTLVIFFAWLSRGIAEIINIETIKSRVVLALCTSIVYVCGWLLGMFSLRSDVFGFRYFQGMFGFAILILPANLIALFPPKKNLRIIYIIVLYLIYISYMLFWLFV